MENCPTRDRFFARNPMALFSSPSDAPFPSYGAPSGAIFGHPGKFAKNGSDVETCLKKWIFHGETESVELCHFEVFSAILLDRPCSRMQKWVTKAAMRFPFKMFVEMYTGKSLRKFDCFISSRSASNLSSKTSEWAILKRYFLHIMVSSDADFPWIIQARRLKFLRPTDIITGKSCAENELAKPCFSVSKWSQKMSNWLIPVLDFVVFTPSSSTQSGDFKDIFNRKCTS